MKRSFTFVGYEGGFQDDADHTAQYCSQPKPVIVRDMADIAVPNIGYLGFLCFKSSLWF